MLKLILMSNSQLTQLQTTALITFINLRFCKWLLQKLELVNVPNNTLSLKPVFAGLFHWLINFVHKLQKDLQDTEWEMQCFRFVFNSQSDKEFSVDSGQFSDTANFE